jgi:hypothetical protein
MRRRVVRLLVIAGVVTACGGAPDPVATDGPVDVVQAFMAARNAGDVDRAMSYLAEEGSIFGVGIHLDDNRDVLAETFRAQVRAGWSGEDADCEVDGERVTCRYRQSDDILRHWSLELTGRHRYAVRDGKIAFAERVHDPAAQRSVYDAAAAFREWVAAERPDQEAVIWVDRASALYTTTEGAEAIFGLLDAYDAHLRGDSGG